MLHQLLAVWPPLLLAAIHLVFLVPLSDVSAVLAICFALLMCLDADARLEEFDNVTRALKTSVNPAAAVVYFSRRHRTSWCQREMMKAAAGTVGMRDVAEDYFLLSGYRWYHVFPDGTFSRNCPFLKPAFWQSLVGLKRA